MDTSAPQIRMQCPKCGRTFPLDVSHCDDCSVMLEPVEQEAPEETTAPPAAAESAIETPAPAAGITPERMEDVALDTLKADVEMKFISALLLELDQARKRLGKKGTGPEADGLRNKITRIETTLERLTEKIQTDAGQLEVQLAGLSRPGPAGMFSSEGRYFRMLSSELKTKRSLLRMLASRRPPSFPTFTRLRTVLTPLAVLLLLSASGLAVYWHLAERRTAPQSLVPPAADRQPSRVAEREIMQLLDEIRKANLTKDLVLWESRYAAAYLAQPGKREGIAEQWAKMDYQSLSYAVDEISTGPSGVSALVTWTMDVAPKEGVRKTVVQRLRADFVREGGVLKIASVRKQ